MNISEQIISPVVAEYNKDFGGSVPDSKDAVLSGQGGTLDSMELVNFLMMVETKIQQVTGKNVGLTTQEALTMKDNPFQTLGSLEKYIATKVS